MILLICHKRSLLLAILGCALCAATTARAQGRGGGGRPGEGSSQGAPGGSQNQPGGSQNQPGGSQGQPGYSQPGIGAMGAGSRGAIPPAAGTEHGNKAGHGMSGSLQNGPVGRWWDDKNYSNALRLRPDQKKRMDAIFNGNRGELAERVQTLRQEEAKLEDATREGHLAHESIFGQMDRVAQARDALEKVNTRVLESLRKELDPDQAARIQTLQ